MNKTKQIVRRLRALTVGALAALSITLSVGCGGADDDVVLEACERFDECNILEGQSVGECAEAVDRNLLTLTPTEQRDWERLMDGCLSFEGCGTFVDCVVGNGL